MSIEAPKDLLIIKNGLNEIPDARVRLEPELEPINKSKIDRFETVDPAWLALLQDFRTMDWTEVYKYPTVMLQQMQQLVGTDQ